MLNYISQSIVFALALMGTLFKSTKTDAEGNTMHSVSGLPMLTTTGKVVVTLLAISFCISLEAIREKNNSETEARDAQKRAEARTQDIDEVVKKVYELSTKLGEDQAQQFQGVLTQQENTGNDIAAGINSSADLLQSRIETSSTLLGGRIGTSINLLNHSADAIASLTDPITTIGIQWLIIEIPLKDPALLNYRERVEPVIRNYRSSRENPNHLGCESAPVGVTGVFIPSNSSLLPRRTSEPEAYYLLTSVNIDVFLFKKPLTDEELVADPDFSYDLNVPVERHLKPTTEESACGIDKSFRLYYDIDRQLVFVFIKALNYNRPAVELQSELSPTSDTKHVFENWNKRAGGKINGIPDLAHSQLVVRLGIPFGTGGLALSNVTTSKANQIASVVRSVRQQSRMISLDIAFSGEFGPRFVGDKGSRVGPFEKAREMRRVANAGGFPYYVYSPLR